jgi:hypothetical protein
LLLIAGRTAGRSNEVFAEGENRLHYFLATIEMDAQGRFRAPPACAMASRRPTPSGLQPVRLNPCLVVVISKILCSKFAPLAPRNSDTERYGTIPYVVVFPLYIL